jgi:uncharacterized protein (TIGR02266 family)
VIEDGANKRKYERVPLSLLVQYRFNTVQEFLSEYAVNMSIGGMYIKTDEPREVGELIYFQFVLMGGDKLIEGLGKVTWASGDPKSRGIGIEFVNMDDESMDLISQIVADRSKKAD